MHTKKKDPLDALTDCIAAIAAAAHGSMREFNTEPAQIAQRLDVSVEFVEEYLRLGERTDKRHKAERRRKDAAKQRRQMRTAAKQAAGAR